MFNTQNVHAVAHSGLTHLQKAIAAFVMAIIFSSSVFMLSVTVPTDIAGKILLFDAVYAGDYQDGNGS